LTRVEWLAGLGRHPASAAILIPLQRAFDPLTAKINAMINEALLAAQNLTHLRQGCFVKQG
jgi:hypothetical protein